jgi:DNA gyrase subunit A
VVRSRVDEVPAKGRNTMGVVFARFPEGDRIIGIARNTERGLEEGASEDAEGIEGSGEQQPADATPTESKESLNE